jgi:tetratricopeptide (TPR) repeat protein
MQGSIQESVLLEKLEKATQELQIFAMVEWTVEILTASEKELLQRLPVYKTFVTMKGVEQIAQDLPNPQALLQRLIDLSLVEVEQPTDSSELEYQITPLVAEWLNTRATLPLELRREAADYQQWVHDNLHKTLDQGIATHEALVYAELQEDADKFALDWIVPHFDRIGRYQLLLDQWLPTLRASEKLEIKGRALNESGLAHYNLSNYDQALEYHQQSLAITREIGNRNGEGATLNNISLIFQAKGDYDTALNYLKKSLAITRKIGDRNGEGMTLNNISQIFKARGDYDTALNYLKKSIAIQRKIGDRNGEGTTLNNISQIFKARGDYDTALNYLKKSLAIQRKIGDRNGEGTTLNNLAGIARAKGDYDTALDYLKQSLEIQREIGDRNIEGTTLNNISQIYDARGDYDTALDYLKQSLVIQREIGDVAGLCATLFNIGYIHLKNKEFQEARTVWVQVYRIAKQIGLAEALNKLDNLAKKLGGAGLKFWEELARRFEA